MLFIRLFWLQNLNETDNFQVNTNYTLVHQVSYNFLYVFGALFWILFRT